MSEQAPENTVDAGLDVEATPDDLGELVPDTDPADPAEVAPHEDAADQDADATQSEADPAGDNAAVVRAGSAAVAWAMARVRAGTSGYRGLCLRFTRECLHVPARYSSARVAWSHVAVADRHGGTEPPPGVPVFWAIGSNWHVALSAGGGWVVSTDILRRGKADRVRLSLITTRWGARYLGWTETLNGVRVYSKPDAEPLPAINVARIRAATAHPTRGLHRHQIRIVERALALEGLMDDRWVDGKWGSRSARAWRRWERRIGIARPNGIPDHTSLTRLGRRHRFTVHD